MIFTDRIITVRKGESKINEPIIVYRGDYELEVRFTIMNSKFKFMSGTNLIESENAAYGQLAILTPYGGNIFSDIVKCNEGTVTFVLTKEMLDQIEEVGLYSFQIRLFDYNKESRVSIPPVEFGIEVREPITSEDHDNSINNAIVGYSIAKIADALNEEVPDTFNSIGDYNKTIWETGDRITEGKLNKIEDAIDTINQNEIADVAALDKRITNNFNVLDSSKADKNDYANIQTQINNLVLGAVGDGNNAEVVQARDIYSVLNDRLNYDEKALMSVINSLKDGVVIKEVEWEHYGISNYDGANTTNPNRIRTKDFIKLNDGDCIVCRCYTNSEDIRSQVMLMEYDSNLNFIRAGSWVSGQVVNDTAGKYYRLNVRNYKADDQTEHPINVSDANDIVIYSNVSNNILMDEIILDPADFVYGSISADGTESTSLDGGRSLSYYQTRDNMIIYNPKQYSVSIHYYDLEGSEYIHKDYVGHADINAEEIFQLPNVEYGYFKVVVRPYVVDKPNINTSQVIDLVNSIKIFTMPIIEHSTTMLINEHINTAENEIYNNTLEIIRNATGDELEPFNLTDFEPGAINPDGTLLNTESGLLRNLRSSVYYNSKSDIFLFNPKGYSVSIHFYDLVDGEFIHKNYIGHADINQSKFFKISNNNRCDYFKVIFRTHSKAEQTIALTDEIKNDMMETIHLVQPYYTESATVDFYNDYPQLFAPYKFKLQAHRGFSNEYPENTVLAFEEAGKSKAYVGMETDVQRTSDGVFVLMHDDTIDRTTNGTGYCHNYTYAELQNLYIDGGYGWSTDYAGQLKIPTLEEYLEVCRLYELIPYIEIKTLDNQGLSDLLDFLNTAGFKGRCVITSFNWSYLTYIRSITDEYILEYMTTSTNYNSLLNQLKSFKNMILRISAYSVTKEIVDKFRSNGILVECYGLNVGDKTKLEYLKRIGVEGVTCNSHRF